MAISIITPIKNIVGYEGEYIDEKIYYEGSNLEFIQLSSSLPSSLILSHNIDNNYIQLYGTLPLIEDEETYYVSYRLVDSINDDEFIDGYFEITNKNKQRGPLTEIIKDKDLFIGVSAPNLVTAEMVKTMAKDPIVFAMANPTPEIMPDVAKEGGAKVVATVEKQGRSPKIIVFKMKPKKNYRKKQGHRQAYTKVLIKEIVLA